MNRFRDRIVYQGEGAPAGADPAPAVDPAPAAPVVEGAAGSSLLNADPPADPPVDPPVDPAKPADPPVDPAKPADPAPEPIKPEDYKLEGLPEGITAEDDLVVAFLDGAAKGGMDNDSVNAVIQALGPKMAERMNAGAVAYKQMNETWQAEALADPVLAGGDPAKLTANMGVVKTAINTLGLPAEMVTSALQALELTGAGNHPAVLRVIYGMASRLSEAPPVTGTPPNADGESVAKRMYPNTR